MKSQNIVMTIILLLNFEAFGFSLNANKLEKQLKAQIRKTNNTKKFEEKNCAGFAGHWVGECTDRENQKETSDVIIKQTGCTELIFISKDEDGTPSSTNYSADGSALRSEIKSSMMNSFGLISAIKWSQDRQILFMDAEALVNSAYLPTVFKLKVSGQMMFDNDGNLVLFEKIDQDFAPEHQEKSCIYKKQ
jgi:hypothetical protein